MYMSKRSPCASQGETYGLHTRCQLQMPVGKIPINAREEADIQEKQDESNDKAQIRADGTDEVDQRYHSQKDVEESC